LIAKFLEYFIFTFPIVVFTTAASFSVTRIVSLAVGKLFTKSPRLNLVGMLLLLVLQYISLCYFGGLSQSLLSFEMATTINEKLYWVAEEYPKGPKRTELVLADPRAKDYIKLQMVLARSFERGTFHPLEYNGTPILLYPLLVLFVILPVAIYYLTVPEVFVWCFGILLIYLPNFIRVLMMVIFIVSYLLKPLQSPIMQLWARIVESDTPIFTLLFGVVAGLGKAIEGIMKILW
jgi:hypothetical protein